MSPRALASVPEVCDVTFVRGPQASVDTPPSLLLEVPHGATRAADYDALRAQLRGDYPDDLQAFFFVNTDVGAPEVAAHTAERFVASRPDRTALIVRCLVPRTFVDCNRRIDPDAVGRGSVAGEITPGLHAYVRDPDDRRLLLDRYGAYRALATAAYALVCGAGGRALMVHSYAPRSIDVDVDERVVERLREEYRPERIGHWPLRAEIDLISHTGDGRLLASAALADAVTAEATAAGFAVATGATYSLHEATLAHEFAVRHPDATLCLEVRRDLLVGEFTPFAEMHAAPEKVGRIAAALALALGRVL